MNPSLTSALSEFSKGRLASGSSNESNLPTNRWNLITIVRSGLGKLVPFALVRFLLFFLIGVAATLAWQSYGSAAREAIASWSPRLGWLAPAATPVAASPERLKATSLALAGVRQSVDKLATEIGKMQAQGTPDRASASPSSASPSSRQGPRHP
jgi:hypothetical protein